MASQPVHPFSVALKLFTKSPKLMLCDLYSDREKVTLKVFATDVIAVLGTEMQVGGHSSLSDG